MADKIKQTAGRNALGKLALNLAHILLCSCPGLSYSFSDTKKRPHYCTDALLGYNECHIIPPVFSYSYLSGSINKT
ncbi:MAG: hypothetical protein IKH75_07160 [Ruminococcus sp.]|nr:hypothetical protein [Ruminococcus sp.]